jgi:ergothioneine biosynthesis protein EgtB
MESARMRPHPTDKQKSTSVDVTQHAEGLTEQLAQRFAQVHAQTESLAAPLSAEDASLQSMPDASPTKWHLAHTSWFFETFLLEQFEPHFKPFDPSFRVLFNSYYNGIGDKHPRPERGLISRPDLRTVLQYRQHISAQVAALIPRLANNNSTFADLMWLGCNHEEQHQELILTDVKHLLAQNPAKPAYQARWPLTTIEAQRPKWHRYEGGLIEIGRVGNSFAFDNESPRHKVFLEPYELASHPVTHGEFAAFVADGGYTRPALWLSLGWDWVQNNRISQPMYWQNYGTHHGVHRGTHTTPDWHTFTLNGIVPIEENTPMCHLSYFEADAFARWRGARLPTEAEWEHAASALPLEGNFADSNALHPLALRERATSDAPQQMFGDVWEWTASAYLPYPRFHAAEGAVGEYNGKFMCNQFVLRGGSCVTPAGHIRASYRNFFPPEARWQFSGLRLARDAT